jgi:hypothetical protein
MSFRLLIECTKDIDELHINFSDGTSSVVSKDNKPKQEKSEKSENNESTKNSKYKEKEFRRPLDTYLDTEDDIAPIKSEKIELPVIPDKQSFKVADELQNLDI